MKMLRFIAFVLVASTGSAQALAAAATTTATIDISTLTVSGGTFTFEDIVTPPFFSSDAFATTFSGPADSEVNLFGASSASVSSDTFATADLVGSLLTATASAGNFTAKSAAEYFQAFTITYDAAGTGGTVTVTVDFSTVGTDPFAANPSAPFVDVFTDVQLDIWAFPEGGLVSEFNDGDVVFGLAVFGFALDHDGTLSASIDLPDMAPGTVLLFATESKVSVFASGVVPIPAPIILLASALSGLGLLSRRRKHSA